MVLCLVILKSSKQLALFKKPLFSTISQKLTAQRQVALIIMQWVQDCSPFLVGPVLEGKAGVNTPISIHVSCETVENVIDCLQNKNIGLQFAERRLKLNNDYVFLPTINFEYQDFEIEVLVFSLRQQHQQPKSKIQNRSMQRINIKGLKELLAQQQ